MGILGEVLNAAAERSQNSAALKKVVSTGTELYAGRAGSTGVKFPAWRR